MKAGGGEKQAGVKASSSTVGKPAAGMDEGTLREVLQKKLCNLFQVLLLFVVVRILNDSIPLCVRPVSYILLHLCRIYLNKVQVIGNEVCA